MGKRIKHVAGAGAGKTTKLMSFLEEEKKRGIAIENICFTSFTQAQRDDVRRRIKEIYPDATKVVINQQVKTIHGAALRACSLAGIIKLGKTDRIIDESFKFGKNKNPYVEFAGMYDLSYYPNQSDPLTMLETDDEDKVYALPAGNVIFSVARYLKSNMMSYNEFFIPLSKIKYTFKSNRGLDVPAVLEAWDRFKRERHIWEHDDYVEYVIAHKIPPYTSVLMFDEYQDVSPAQHELFRQWGNHPLVVRAYFCGDPNQSIYGFRGASPWYIDKLDADECYGAAKEGDMPQSHRCPPEIITVADKILRGSSNMTPSPHRGTVEYHDYADENEFVCALLDAVAKYGSVMILSRFGSNVASIFDILYRFGVPFNGLSGDRVWWWNSVKVTDTDIKVNMSELLNALRCINDYNVNGSVFGVPTVLTHEQAKALLTTMWGEPWDVVKSQVSHCLVKTRGKAVKEQNYSTPEIIRVCSASTGGETDVLEIIDKFNLEQRIRTNLKNVIRNGINVNPDQVNVDTIHASKGLEASCVMLDVAYSSGRMKECYDDRDIMAEERRVYYVGSTRAKNALYFIRVKNSLRDKTLPIAPPVEDAWYDGLQDGYDIIRKTLTMPA